MEETRKPPDASPEVPPEAPGSDPGPIEANYRTGAVVASPAVSAQLAAIRDEWLQPLVDRIAELEHDRGRLEAELAHATSRAEAAERECEEIRQRHEALRAAAVFTAPPAAPAATGGAAAAGTATGAAGAPGPLRRLWQAIRGQ